MNAPIQSATMLNLAAKRLISLLSLGFLALAIAVYAPGCGGDSTPPGEAPTPGANGGSGQGTPPNGVAVPDLQGAQKLPEPVAVARGELTKRVMAFAESWQKRETDFLKGYDKDFKAALGRMSWWKKTAARAYEARKYALIFSDGQRLRPAADLLIAAIEDLEAHGLDAAAYEREALRATLAKVSDEQKTWASAAVAPEGETEDRLWKAVEAVRAGLEITPELVTAHLTKAGLDDAHVPLVDVAEGRLDAMFKAKASLNDALRDLDIALLSRYFRYIYDMRFAKRLHPFHAYPDDATGVERNAEALWAVYEGTDFEDLKTTLEDLEPALPEYRQMMEGLAFYRALAAEVEQVELPSKAKRLRKGSEGDAVVALQKRLAQEGYLVVPGAEPEAAAEDDVAEASPAGAGGADAAADPAPAEAAAVPAVPTSPDAFDGQYGQGLADAVRLYQQTHQLKQTGKMDRITRSSMNKSFATRAKQVEIALQRHRESELHQGEWRFGDPEFPMRARVNLPAFEATFFHHGEVGRVHRVVIGNNALEVDDDTGYKGYFNRTRLFSEQLRTIVINPTWRVPARIKEFELDLKLMDEPDFYEKNNYELVIKDDGTEEVMQLPGPDNALGLVKFLFPNRFSIYMHDTPKKRLFGREIRAFSHGCMRTHEALELAQWLLTTVNGVTEERFKQILDSRETYGIALKTKIPVTIDYNTVGVHSSGRMMFYIDVYKFDRDFDAGKTPYGRPERPHLEQVVLTEK